jgi:hypothetical protein
MALAPLCWHVGDSAHGSAEPADSRPQLKATRVQAIVPWESLSVSVIGAVVGAPQVDALRLAPRLIGLVTGVLLSAADAVVTKAYRPPIVVGALGGAAIGSPVGELASVGHQILGLACQGAV